jgi:predicted ABC-type transport system involved in lysophospholipase L1 biosynthesis ATPase subunit
MDALMENVQREGAALILATHSPEAAQRTDRILTLSRGRLVEAGVVG